MSIEAQARALYERNENKCVPSWGQLGGVTKDVWIERAKALNATQETPKQRTLIRRTRRPV